MHSPDALEGALREHVGDRLRGLAFYDGQEYDVLHVREDVKAYRLKSEVDEFTLHLQRETRAAEEEAFPFEEFRATVRFFGEALVVHLPLEEGTGAIVIVDRDAADRLDELVGACLEHT